MRVFKHPRFPKSRWEFYIEHDKLEQDALCLRPITPDDRLRQEVLFEGMTAEDRQKRFFCMKHHLPPSELRSMTAIDFQHGSFAFAAVSRATDKFVGTARLLSDGRGCVEAAVVTAESHKGMGLGSLLVDLLFRVAIEELHASKLHIEHLQSNPVVRHLFEKAAKRHASACEEGPTEDGICAVTWTLKSTVDEPMQMQDRNPRQYDVNGMIRKFEVRKPAAYPLSLWRYELRLLAPHEGELKSLAVRPVGPDDETRSKEFITGLGEDYLKFYIPVGLSLLGHQSSPDAKLDQDFLGNIAHLLTSYDFTKCLAIAAVDERVDDFVAVARWMAKPESPHDVIGIVAILPNWIGWGIASFVFDIMVQSAITEKKQTLEFMAPPNYQKLADIATNVLRRHASEVQSPCEDGNKLHFTAKLKSDVDEPIRLTQFPAAESSADGTDESLVYAKGQPSKKGLVAEEPAAAAACSDPMDDEADLWGY